MVTFISNSEIAVDFYQIKNKREILIETLCNFSDIFVITCLIIFNDGANRYIIYKIFLDMYENTQISHFFS